MCKENKQEQDPSGLWETWRPHCFYHVPRYRVDLSSIKRHAQFAQLPSSPVVCGVHLCGIPTYVDRPVQLPIHAHVVATD